MNEALIRQTLAANPIKQLQHGGAAEGRTAIKWKLVLINRTNGFYVCYLLVPEQQTMLSSRRLTWIHRPHSLLDAGPRSVARCGLGKFLNSHDVSLATRCDSDVPPEVRNTTRVWIQRRY